MFAHKKVTIHPYKEGDPMSTTMDTLSSRRATALRILSTGEGITPMTELDAEFQELFGLHSSDPDQFVQTLYILRGNASDEDALEAAFYALGIDAMNLGSLRERRDTLLYKRHDGPNWDVHDSGSVEILEIRGFAIIASMFELAGKIQKDIAGRKQLNEAIAELVSAATAASDSQAVPANLRRPLKIALEKLASARS